MREGVLYLTTDIIFATVNLFAVETSGMFWNMKKEHLDCVDPWAMMPKAEGRFRNRVLLLLYRKIWPGFPKLALRIP